MNSDIPCLLPSRDSKCLLRLILMRHGKPAEEIHGRCYGRLDVSLSLAGQEQLRRRIAFLRYLKPDVLYTSTCKRTIESAEVIRKELNLRPQCRAELCEINFGAFEGLSYHEIESRYPQEYKLWMEHPTEVKFTGGENFKEMKERALGFLASLFRVHAGQAVLTLAHGGVNRVILANALRLPTENLFRIDQAYAAVNVIDYYPEFALVRLMNG